MILALLDGAMEWLVSLGRTDQWGSNPASAEPARVARAQEWERDEGLYIATLDGEPVGALVVGEAMPYVPPATVPELYVRFLASDRTRKGSRIGARLLEHAETLARRAGVERLRVDCFRGPDLALVNYYRAQGFTPTETFTVPRPEADDWPGQILVRELAPTV
ncbi:hypothetical protein GCM10023223_40780 [Stackebrandtia albiflava]